MCSQIQELGTTEGSTTLDFRHQENMGLWAGKFKSTSIERK